MSLIIIYDTLDELMSNPRHLTDITNPVLLLGELYPYACNIPLLI